MLTLARQAQNFDLDTEPVEGARQGLRILVAKRIERNARTWEYTLAEDYDAHDVCTLIQRVGAAPPVNDMKTKIFNALLLDGAMGRAADQAK